MPTLEAAIVEVPTGEVPEGAGWRRLVAGSGTPERLARPLAAGPADASDAPPSVMTRLSAADLLAMAAG